MRHPAEHQCSSRVRRIFCGDRIGRACGGYRDTFLVCAWFKFLKGGVWLVKVKEKMGS